MAENWSKQQERSNPFTMRLICGFARRMPRGVTRLLLWPITLYFYLFSPKARIASRNYLQRIPAKRGDALEIFQHLHSFASVVLDRVYFLMDRFDKFHIKIEDEVLSRTLEAGRGVILLGTHIGSFDAMRAMALGYTQFPLKIMIYQDHSAMITRVLDELNPEVAASVINLADDNALLHAKEALDQGAAIGMLGDRCLPGEKQLKCELLGSEVGLPIGPLSLSLVLGVPVIVFFGIYEGGNRYRVSLKLLYAGDKKPRRERDAIIQACMQEYTGMMEEILLKYPYNWFNFYDYWGDEV